MERGQVEHVEVGERRIGYRRSGTGDPLVLLHGGWSDSRSWLPQLASLADAFDVVALDVPGCGGSSDAPPGAGLEWYADIVADAVASLGLQQVHLGGHSFGAGLALAVAQRHPGTVRSLALAGAYAGWAGSLPADEVAARVARAHDELGRPHEEWADAYLDEFFHTDVGPATRALAQTMMREVRPTGALRMIEAFAAADLRPALPAIDVPVLLLVGRHDVRAPVPVAEQLHAALPGSRLVVVPDVGHDVNLEAPGRFDAELRVFLADV